jgi:hypothetical protein
MLENNRLSSSREWTIKAWKYQHEIGNKSSSSSPNSNRHRRRCCCLLVVKIEMRSRIKKKQEKNEIEIEREGKVERDERGHQARADFMQSHLNCKHVLALCALIHLIVIIMDKIRFFKFQECFKSKNSQ